MKQSAMIITRTIYHTILLTTFIIVGFGGCGNPHHRNPHYSLWKHITSEWSCEPNTCLDQQWKSGQTIVTLENGTLQIRGSGAMEDYRNCLSSRDLAPWHSACSRGGGFRRTCRLPITDVVIEDGVTHIGNFAFCGLKRLKSVTIPASVVSIGEGAFYTCDSLISITVADDNVHYASEDGVLFNKDKTTLIRYPQGRSGAYTIPNGVITIGAAAFHNSIGLTSVTIPNTVTTIEPGVSDQEFGRNYIDLTHTIGHIESDINYSRVPGAFGNCIGLTSVTIPSSVTSIGDLAFASCTGLTSITIEDGVKSIGKYAFFGCTNLASVTIPNSVTSIGDWAFSGYTGLTSVTIPSSVTSIGDWAFSGYVGLTSITVADDNAHYSSVDGVLFNKTKDTLIRYPSEKSDAYYTIPSSVTSIGNWAFYGSANLTSVTIPDGVESIGVWAFAHSGLMSVTIPGSVTSIGEGAFYECANLTSVTLGGGILAFRENFVLIFALCHNLSSVTIPNGVNISAMTTLGNRLISIISLNPMPPNVWNRVFSSLPSDACLYVPEGSIVAYRNAEGWNHFNCIKDLSSPRRRGDNHHETK